VGGVENCPLPLTKPVAVNTGLALLRSAARDIKLELNGKPVEECLRLRDDNRSHFLTRDPRDP